MLIALFGQDVGVSEHEPERIVEPEPEVIEGEDELPRQPPQPLDPYTPGGGTARVAGLIAISAAAAIVLAVLLWAFLR
jgi:hypothetical protein